VHFGHHGSDPTHVEVLLAAAVLALDALFDVALHRLLPEALVGHVDGELGGVGRDGHVGVGQVELTNVTIQGEAVDAVTGGQHQHGVGTVQRIASAHLLGAGLQEVLGGRVGHAFRTTQDGEDGADGDVHVDVGRAIQRIEGNQVLAARELGRDGEHVVHLFRCHTGQMAAPAQRIQHDVIGDDVQLLLRFTLDVLAAGTAQHTDQRALVDLMGDLLARGHDVAQQAGEVTGGAGDGALFFDDELDHTLAHCFSLL
jgi:hypothetical protein